jgi:hypothetical protein
LADVDVSNITATSCVVKWSLVLVAGQKFQTCVQEFCVKYQELEGQQVNTTKIQRNRMNQQQSLELKELIPNTKYKVSVSAISAYKSAVLEGDVVEKSFTTASGSVTGGTSFPDIGSKM